MSATMTEPETRLRPMTQDDLAAAHLLSRECQWPHRLDDWQFTLALGQGVVAERGGTLVGTAMWWPYGDKAASLGMVIVSQSCRGGGIGRRLMDAVIARNAGRTLLLNGTAAGLPLYHSLGFQKIGEVRQHQGAAFSVPVASLQAGERIRPLTRSDEAAVVALDTEATGLPRAPLIAALLDVAEGVVLDRDGQAAGFALYRRFGRGHVVGPVVAPDIDGAKALISHWAGSNAGMFLRVDVPGHETLSAWLDDLGLLGVAPVTTMALGPVPPRGTRARSFAIVSQALG